MRGGISRIVVALVLASGCWIAAGCAGESSNSDAGAGAGGSGGGGSGGGGAGDGSTGTVGCLKMDQIPVACPSPPVTYSKVQPILQARCVSVCHNDKTPDPEHPGTTIWGFPDYQHVKDWQDTVRDTVGNCLMPPPDAGIPATIEERIAILEFIKCGLPQ